VGPWLEPCASVEKGRGSNASSAGSSSSSNRRRTIYLPAQALVSSETLNVRAGPGTQFEILLQLKAGDSVWVTSTAGDKWVSVEISVWDGTEIRTLEGYVFHQYLSF